jgi:GT2 family glycosyltransferase
MGFDGTPLPTDPRLREVGAHLPLVYAVILNSNRREDTLACLSSLRSSTYGRLKVVLLDNHSDDGSLSAVQSQFPEVECLQLDRNEGYAGNNNVGIQVALDRHADWVWVLNEDVVVAPDALLHLIAAADARERIGVLGPTVYHHDEPDIIQSAGGILDAGWGTSHRGHNERDAGQYPRPETVDWISGCALLARATALHEVGLLDARFFYYWEETEWCLRARGAGWASVHVPAAKIWHKGVRRDYAPSPSVTYYSTRNRLLMMAKHHAPLGAWRETGASLGRTLLSWSLRPKWSGKRPHRDAMWQGLWDFLRQRWGIRPE